VRHLIHSAVRAGAPHSRNGSQRFLEPPVLFMGDEPCHTGKHINASTCRSALAIIGRKRPLGTLVDSSTVSRIRTSLSGKTPAGRQGHDLRRSGLASRRWLAFQCTAGHAARLPARPKLVQKSCRPASRECPRDPRASGETERAASPEPPLQLCSGGRLESASVGGEPGASPWLALSLKSNNDCVQSLFTRVWRRQPAGTGEEVDGARARGAERAESVAVSPYFLSPFSVHLRSRWRVLCLLCSDCTTPIAELINCALTARRSLISPRREMVPCAMSQLPAVRGLETPQRRWHGGRRAEDQAC
jgi:hypothetical protein